MNSPTFRSVFHPSDFTEGDQHAFEHALRIALANRSELCLLHVAEPTAGTDWRDFPSVRRTLEAWGVLPPQATREAVVETGLRARKVQRRGTDPAEEIVGYVAEEKPDLVVLATHQRSGIGRWLHRALAEPISRVAGATLASTLVIPRRVLGFVRGDTGRVTLRRILIAVDRTPHPQHALNTAAALARSLGCPEVHFILLHIGAEGDAPNLNPPTDPGWTSETQSWEGPVVEHLLESAEANEVDLLVLAKRGQRTVLDALRGSTTERVIRGARCPVLVVPVNE